MLTGYYLSVCRQNLSKVVQNSEGSLVFLNGESVSLKTSLVCWLITNFLTYGEGPMGFSNFYKKI